MFLSIKEKRYIAIRHILRNKYSYDFPPQIPPKLPIYSTLFEHVQIISFQNSSYGLVFEGVKKP